MNKFTKQTSFSISFNHIRVCK